MVRGMGPGAQGWQYLLRPYSSACVGVRAGWSLGSKGTAGLLAALEQGVGPKP